VASFLATMHLTNKEPIRRDAFVESGYPDTAGAPEQEIEITPEMIDAGLSVLYRFPITEPVESEMREAVAAVYRAMSNIRKPLRESF
jgi:hypothetical protein